MGYPAKLLAEGERIDFEMRPHWKSDDRARPSCCWRSVVVGGFLIGKAPDNAAGDGLTWVVVIGVGDPARGVVRPPAARLAHDAVRLHGPPDHHAHRASSPAAVATCRCRRSTTSRSATR